MADSRATDPANAGLRSTTHPQLASANGAWPDLPAELTGLARNLAADGTAVQPARPEYVAALRARFEQATQTAAEAWARSQRTAPPALTARLGLLRQRWVLPVAFTAVAVLTVAVLAPRLGGAVAPPPVDRATLVARNTRAWSQLTTLTGAFVTGDGWYYEEWISRAEGGVLRFKRYIRPPARTPNRPQWDVSDGRTEWVVDAGSGKVRATRDAVPGDVTAIAPNDAMQCTSLALPPGVSEGPAPTPLVLDGRAVYRLSGQLADGAAAVFWVDADDALVRRIDRPGLGTVWQRQRLDLDPPLAADIFRPVSLTNL